MNLSCQYSSNRFLNEITGESTKKASLKTHEGAAPSGMDAECRWMMILQMS